MIEIFIGDYVVVLTDCLEPVGNVSVGVKAPQATLRSHVEYRTQTRGVTNSGVVSVLVVKGQAVFGVFLQKYIIGSEHRDGAAFWLGKDGVHRKLDVGVCHVCRGRDQQHHVRSFFASRWTHKERYAVFVLAADQPRTINTAAHGLRDCQREVGLPAGVVEIVIMKVNRTVLLRRVSPAMLTTRPVVTANTSGRHVHDGAV